MTIRNMVRGSLSPAVTNQKTLTVTVTFDPVAHKHSDFTFWSSSATQHWHTCVAEGCDAPEDTNGYSMVDLGLHVDADDDGTCDVCEKPIGYQITFYGNGGRVGAPAVALPAHQDGRHAAEPARNAHSLRLVL